MKVYSSGKFKSIINPRTGILRGCELGCLTQYIWKLKPLHEKYCETATNSVKIFFENTKGIGSRSAMTFKLKLGIRNYYIRSSYEQIPVQWKDNLQHRKLYLHRYIKGYGSETTWKVGSRSAMTGQVRSGSEIFFGYEKTWRDAETRYRITKTARLRSYIFHEIIEKATNQWILTAEPRSIRPENRPLSLRQH